MLEGLLASAQVSPASQLIWNSESDFGLMQLVGWHRGFFCKEVDLLSMETQALRTSFAGNAFSGFAAIACLIDLIATVGLLEKGSLQSSCGPQAVDGQGDFQRSASEAAKPLARLPTDDL